MPGWKQKFPGIVLPFERDPKKRELHRTLRYLREAAKEGNYDDYIDSFIALLEIEQKRNPGFVDKPALILATTVRYFGKELQSLGKAYGHADMGMLGFYITELGRGGITTVAQMIDALEQLKRKQKS